jgi:ATP synthase F1 gamma subunit
MANLKTLKTRIKSVKSTQKMTKAMKMVAASRLKKAKQLVEASRPFADKIQEMVSSLPLLQVHLLLLLHTFKTALQFILHLINSIHHWIMKIITH